jgi:hypothetical protein
MPTVVQFRRGTTAQNNNFLGANGEISVDTTLNVLRVADAVTLGGHALVGQDCVQTIANKTYTGTSLSVTGNVTGSYIFGNGSQLTGIDATSIQSGTSNVRVVSSGGNVATGIGGTSNVVVVATTGQFVTGVISATGNITGSYIFGNGSQLTGIASPYGNSNVASFLASFGNNNISTTGNITVGNIINANANGVGNIGSSGSYFDTIFAKATSAQYADLAEMYVADADYPPGTVVEFGGDHEVTVARQSHSTSVAGIVSTSPSYIMNSKQTGTYVLPIALTGRVPCQVIGSISKGDRLVSSEYMGVAKKLETASYQPGCIIGKSLENYDSDQIGLIEVAVGRF